jgi:branched-chain amino acid transport system ATP-binding protein
MPAHRVAELRVAQSPEGRRVFPRMSVLENLQMGAFIHGKMDPADLARVFDLFPRLKERSTQKAGTMSGGEQQMLAIGRALMAKPDLLLLDEPSMGLAPILVEQIFSIVQDINKQGTTVLLVEQNALMALGIAQRGYVLQTGSILLNDSAEALLRNEMVRKAYLGEI